MGEKQEVFFPKAIETGCRDLNHAILMSVSRGEVMVDPKLKTEGRGLLMMTPRSPLHLQGAGVPALPCSQGNGRTHHSLLH